jgi:hypothetical protein
VKPVISSAPRFQNAAVHQMNPVFRAVRNRLADLRRDFAGQFHLALLFERRREVYERNVARCMDATLIC